MDVKADYVQKAEWSHRVSQRSCDSSVDGLNRAHAGFEGADAVVFPWDEEPVDNESWPVLGHDSCLAEALEEIDGTRAGLCRGVPAVGDLDQLHQRGRVAVMRANDPLGMPRTCGDSGPRQRGGVGVQER